MLTSLSFMSMAIPCIYVSERKSEVELDITNGSVVHQTFRTTTSAISCMDLVEVIEGRNGNPDQRNIYFSNTKLPSNLSTNYGIQSKNGGFKAMM